MNVKQLIRKWAQMSNAYFWIGPLVVTIYYLVYKENPLMKERYLFVLVALTAAGSSYQLRCLSREIVRLEEKLKNLKDALLEKLKKRSLEITKEDTAVPFPYK
ncbi:hypothetical protein QUB05_23200 [Microcoleus sp. F10-C6]|uniref:hypothetical protein n=1 Tax=unclassified Microcoleus TaxID=2642155 RepID=UPI002FD4E2B1